MEALCGAPQALGRCMDVEWGVKWERQPENFSKVKLTKILTFKVHIYIYKNKPNKTNNNNKKINQNPTENQPQTENKQTQNETKPTKSQILKYKHLDVKLLMPTCPNPRTGHSWPVMP